MAMVGEFPGLQDFRRRTVRAEVNPLDKSTIFSVYPKRIEEIKHTIQPGKFVIEAGRENNPTLLVVGPSSWWKELEEDQPLLEIPQSSIQIANSIVRDYCVGLLGCNMNDHMPGLFYVPGEFKAADLKTNPKLKPHLDRAIANQKRWYSLLVKMADSLWARTNGNPLTISDDMRLAAREMGINNKDWLKDYQSIEQVRCVACGSLRNPEYPICPTCHAIVDVARAKELNIKFAE